MARLKRWQELGYASDMHWMYRSPDMLIDPKSILPNALSLVSVGISYEAGPISDCPLGFGRVARYAVGRDYHKTIKKLLTGFVSCVRNELGREIEYRVCTDAIPLLERAIGERAGIGFIGKNGMLIQPGMGSFTFLAEILWNVEIEGLMDCASSKESRCGPCRNCLDSCPGGAIVESHIVNASRCISYLTIEKRDVFTIEERTLIGEWVFGCDLCQECCPQNGGALSKGQKADLVEFASVEGTGQFVDLKDILNLNTDADFIERFMGSSLVRAKRQGLIRNAICVAVNTSCEHLCKDIRALLNDPSPMVRQHAVWALFALKSKCNCLRRDELKGIIEPMLNDDAQDVQKEALGCLEQL